MLYNTNRYEFMQKIGTLTLAYYLTYLITKLILHKINNKKLISIMSIHSNIFFITTPIVIIVLFFNNNPSETNIDIDSDDSQNSSILSNQYTSIKQRYSSLLANISNQDDIYSNENNAVKNNTQTIIGILNQNYNNLLNATQDTQTLQNNTQSIIDSINEIEQNSNIITTLTQSTPNSYNGTSQLEFIYTYKDILNCIKNIYRTTKVNYQSGIAANNNIDTLLYNTYNFDGSISQKNGLFIDDNQSIDFEDAISLLYTKECNNFLIKKPLIGNDDIITKVHAFPYNSYQLNIYANKFSINSEIYNIIYDSINQCITLNDSIYIFKDFIFNNDTSTIIKHDIDGYTYEINNNSISQLTQNISNIFTYELSILQANTFIASFTIKANGTINIKYTNNNSFQTYNIFNNNENIPLLSNIDISTINDANQDCEYICMFWQDGPFNLVMICNNTLSRFIVQQYNNQSLNPLFSYNN